MGRRTGPYVPLLFHQRAHAPQQQGYDQYSEILLNDKDQRFGDNGRPTKTINPMFTYTCVHEEGEKFEWRYYFDENGRCIETKSNHEDTDGGKADKLKTRRLLHVFNALMNP